MNYNGIIGKKQVFLFFSLAKTLKIGFIRLKKLET